MSLLKVVKYTWMAFLILIAGLAAGAAGTPTTLNLSSEANVLEGYGQSLVQLNSTGAGLFKRSSILNADLVSLNSSAESLKRQLPQVQQAARSVIDKLKQSGQWDTLDKAVIAETKDAKLQSFWSACGGAQRVLEDVAAGNGLVDELTIGINALRPKVKAQAVMPLVLRSNSSDVLMDDVLPVSLGGGPGFSCRLAMARVKVTTVLNGGNPSQRSTDAAYCNCPMGRDSTVNPWIDCGSTR